MAIPPDEPLISNGYTLSRAPERLGDLIASNPTAPMHELRAQYEEQGYLWLKGLLDRTVVLTLRERYFRAMESTGLLAPGSKVTEAHYAHQPYDRALHDKLLMELVRTAAYEAFCLNERIWQFYEAFLGGAVYLHKRKILRTGLPGAEWNTPAHYDLIYLRGGTDSVVTAWIPIGDTPIEMGGLIYLEGSDRLGRQMEAEFAAKNAELSPEERISAYNKNMLEGGWVSQNLPEMAERFNARWLVADYEAGDVMFHSAYMIHAATMNIHPSRIRLSTDIRYQRVRDEIDARWTQHWTLNDML
ncbi:MAG: phytanoyl-CoA dioxygenase family protein [Roseiflexaceae bacterium]|nr:phytanoyl-CoA dioxygenase family protein [Roseiflexaceae bacterium]